MYASVGVFLLNAVPSFLYLVFLSNWRNTRAVKGRGSVLREAQKAQQYLTALALGRLLTFPWAHLHGPEQVGSFAVEEVMRTNHCGL